MDVWVGNHQIAAESTTKRKKHQGAKNQQSTKRIQTGEPPTQKGLKLTESNENLKNFNLVQPSVSQALEESSF
jgi:hypothetical protein